MRAQERMRKCASLKYIKSQKIDFNPSEFRVGKSRIDALPILSRKSSLSKVQIPNGHGLQYDNNQSLFLVEELNRTIKHLTKQNTDLRKRLNDQICSTVDQLRSKKPHTDANKPLNTSKDEKAYILSRINNTNNKSKASTQCETGILNSKFNEQTIPELYQSLEKGVKLQSCKLLNIAKNYFEQFQENYLKLKMMVEYYTYETKREKQDQRHLNDFLTLFKVPIIFKKTPQLLMKSISRQKQSKNSLSKGCKNVPPFCAEMKSAQETIRTLETIMAKVVKSEKMVQMLRGHQTLKKLFKRISS